MEAQKNHKELGNREYKNSNYKKAIEHYRQYVDVDHDDNIQALSNIALCYFKLQLFDRAIQACDEALSIDEKYAKCYYRRALSRKAILDRDRDDKIQKYKLYYDVNMFKRYSEPGTNIKEIEELTLVSNTLKQQFVFCDPIRLTPFQRDLLEIEKDNLNLLALSWLEQRKTHENLNFHQSTQYKINALYKELIKANRQIKDAQEKNTIIDHIKRKIKQIKQMEQKQKNLKSDEITDKTDMIKTIKEQSQTQIQLSQQIEVDKQQINLKSQQMEKNNQMAKEQKLKTQNQNKEPIKTEKNKQLIKDSREMKKIQNLNQTVNNQLNRNQKKQTIKQNQSNQKEVNVTSNVNENHNQFKIVNEGNQEASKNKQNTEKNNLNLTNASPIKTQPNNKKSEENFSQMNIQQLYKHYFGEEFTKTRDQFSQFGANILETLQKTQLSISKKQDFLLKVAKTRSNFKLLIKNIPKPQRKLLNELLQKQEFSQQIKKCYLIK